MAYLDAYETSRTAIQFVFLARNKSNINKRPNQVTEQVYIYTYRSWHTLCTGTTMIIINTATAEINEIIT